MDEAGPPFNCTSITKTLFSQKDIHLDYFTEPFFANFIDFPG